MRRELVRFDSRRFWAVDTIALRRAASALLDVLPKVVGPDVYEIDSRLMPAIRKAIAGEIRLPYEDDGDFINTRYLRDYMEGTLPLEYGRDFQRAFAAFSVLIRSVPLKRPEIEMVDGVQHAWMDIEEDGDWPDRSNDP